MPVLSYLLSSGRCRHCGARVSPLYVLGEAATGLLFLWVYLQFGLTGKGAIGFVLVSLSVIVTVADLRYMLIPNKVLLFFTPLLLVLVIFLRRGRCGCTCWVEWLAVLLYWCWPCSGAWGWEM